MSHCIFAQPKPISLEQVDQRMMLRPKQVMNAANTRTGYIRAVNHNPWKAFQGKRLLPLLPVRMACIPLRNGAVNGIFPPDADQGPVMQ